MYMRMYYENSLPLLKIHQMLKVNTIVFQQSLHETLLIFLRCMNEGVDLSSFIKSGSIFNCLCNLEGSRSILAVHCQFVMSQVHPNSQLLKLVFQLKVVFGGMVGQIFYLIH